jgi:hypothetical protein
MGTKLNMAIVKRPLTKMLKHFCFQLMRRLVQGNNLCKCNMPGIGEYLNDLNIYAA